MIQDQLVDYIASQVKLGVSRDSIKTALVGVGWAAQDVEDTFKKVEQPAAGIQQPAAAAPQQPGASGQPAASVGQPAATASRQPAAAQVIRVSDLVSASLTPTVLSSPSRSNAQKVSPGMMQGKMGAAPAMGEASKKRMGKSAYIMIGLILVLAGVSAYLYFENSSLSSQMNSQGAQNQGSASQVASLNNQVQALTASSTVLTAQIAELSAQVQELQEDLSFFMVPAGDSASVPVAVTVSGTLSGGKPTYVVTTLEGVKVTVKNSSNADVQAALAPLLGASSTVEISGTHNPGVASVTVSDVNGQPVTPPPAMASSSETTSSAMMASSTATSSGQ